MKTVLKHLVSVSLLFMFCCTVIAGHDGWRKDEMEIRITLDSQESANTLMKLNFSVESANPEGTSFYAYVTPSELEMVKAAGIRYTISIPNLNDHYRGFWTKKVPPGYKTYEEIVGLADSLALNFPSICKKVLFGTSHGGRELGALKISSNVNLNENKPAVLFDGGIHGDEIMGPEVLIRYARELCSGYGINPVYTGLINTKEIWIYYMVNPDGRVSMSRYNNNGVDCNRDAGYMWNGEGNSNGAFSQKETKALRNCMLENQVVLFSDFHGGAEFLVYPWSYRSEPSPDNTPINHLAAIYSINSGYPSFPYGQGYSLLGYYSNGSTKDYQYGTMGNVGWTIEMTNEKQPPSSQIQNYYNYNVPAMTEVISKCGNGIEGIVTDSITGDPLSAIVWINNFYPVYTDQGIGDYHKYLPPGNYSVKVTANGYQSRTIQGVGVSSSGSTIKNFQLTPEPGWFVFRVSGCQIPLSSFSGFSSPAYTPAVIGTPDSLTYSLWKNGWIILDMGDTIFNGPGDDFRVVESGGTPEGFYCYVSSTKDGPWRSVGSGMGSTSFDLDSAAGGMVSKVRYLKIIDDGDGPSSGSDLGFDLDAVEMLTPPLIANFTASSTITCTNSSVDFTDHSSGNPVSWLWTFPGGTPGSSTEQNPSGIIYETPGIFNAALSITNGTSSSIKTRTDYLLINPSPSVWLGNDTTLNSSSSVLLDAGNPGSAYFWSTGDTTQTIFVDSTGTGIGSKNISVLVTNNELCTASDSIRITFSEIIEITESSVSGKIKIFPNPVQNVVHIVAEDPEIGLVKVFSSPGQVVLEKTFSPKQKSVTIYLHGLRNGLYFVEITGERKKYYQKIIIGD